MVEIMKSGLANTHMTFEKDKIHMTQYETPYGELLVGIHTRISGWRNPKTGLM